MEWLYLGVYTVDLLLRCFTYGRQALYMDWVRFDAFLVVCEYLELIMFAINSDAVEQGIIGILKVFRLAKLVRPLRSIPAFRPVWRLLRGIISTGSTVVYTFSVVLLFVFVFA